MGPEMAQEVKILTTEWQEPYNLNLIPGSHIKLQGKNWPYTVMFSHLHMHTVTYTTSCDP